MPNWWVIYAETGLLETRLYARAFESQPEAQEWAKKTHGIVMIDIAEGQSDKS